MDSFDAYTGEQFANVYCGSGDEARCIARAFGEYPHENARLIAAAPDLLEALRALVGDANRLCDRQLGGTYEDDCRRTLEAARTAIAKAEGR